MQTIAKRILLVTYLCRVDKQSNATNVVYKFNLRGTFSVMIRTGSLVLLIIHKEQRKKVEETQPISVLKITTHASLET